jgi:hypothetical protein
MTDFAPLTLETLPNTRSRNSCASWAKASAARDLTREEAREAMGMVLDDKVEDTQLGAFLMLLRHKEESAEEMAGFTEALRERLHAPALNVDLDWPTYAGKKRTCRGTCWRPSAWRKTACASSCTAAAPTPPGACTPNNCWAACRSRCAATGSRSAALDTAAWRSCRWVDWAPQLQRMIDLRNTLGLRSPIHSLARILNPLAPAAACKAFSTPATRRAPRCQRPARRQCDCQGRWRRDRDQPGCRQPSVRHHRRRELG